MGQRLRRRTTRSTCKVKLGNWTEDGTYGTHVAGPLVAPLGRHVMVDSGETTVSSREATALCRRLTPSTTRFLDSEQTHVAVEQVMDS